VKQLCAYNGGTITEDTTPSTATGGSGSIGNGSGTPPASGACEDPDDGGFGQIPGDKTAAKVGGSRTLSGWGPVPEGFSRVSPQEVLALQSEMGFPARRAGAYDQGVPGQYFASHAERQASILEPDQPIEVSEGMCDDCQEYFQCLANYRGVGQQVTDPNGSYTFEPEG
jgi:filamentous hemagglutinin